MKKYTKEQIIEIAENQIKIIFYIIFLLLLTGGSARYPLISLILSGIMAYFMYQFAKAMAVKLPIIIAILMFIPIVSIITLLVINQNATKILINAGLRVGFFGPDKNELERFKNSKIWGSANKN